MMQKGDVTVRKAVVDDVKDIHALLMQAALKGQLLPRALTYLYGHVRNFFVLVKPDGEIVGCVALAPGGSGFTCYPRRSARQGPGASGCPGVSC